MFSMKFITIILAAFAVLGSHAQRVKYNTKAQRTEGMINVHIVPHTHNDVGWLKTVDQYFYGANNTIQKANVNTIISSVVNELGQDPNRWWEGQGSARRNMAENLIKSEQLEFINGGWCMHDEAASYFIDMIDQTALGHRYINTQFGAKYLPKTTWQIDPFGHSGFQGSMMSSPLSGYNSVFYGRADYRDQQRREEQQTTEYFWQTSPSLGDSTGTLGGIMPHHYSVPEDLDPTQIPVMDDANLCDYNVEERVNSFVNISQFYAKITASDDKNTTDIMIMMGADFTYADAPTWFTNIDKYIHYVNQDNRVRAFYSTPSIYAQSKLDNLKLPVRYDDLFPYANQPHATWSGYFTSRPAFKRYARDTSAYSGAVRQLQFLNGGADDLSRDNGLYLLERALAVSQHHDGLSGTAKQHVTDDYAQRLARGRNNADKMLASIISDLTGDDSSYVTCDLANATICPALENGQATTVVLYNSQAQALSAQNVLLPVGLGSAATLDVYDPTGQPVVAQLYPLSANDIDLRKNYYSYPTPNPDQLRWLAFQANLPAFGYAAYFISPPSSSDSNTQHKQAPSLTHISEPVKLSINTGGDDIDFTNGLITLIVDGTTGLFKSFLRPGQGQAIPFSQNFYYYNASIGNTHADPSPAPAPVSDLDQPSGAYIFRPNSSTAFPVGPKTVNVQVISGPVVNELQQTFGPWVSQAVRLWKDKDYVDFEYYISGIDISDNHGKEVITRYETGLASQGTWYTDSNGRDSMKRDRNLRPDFPGFKIVEPIADNYFPVNVFQYLSDESSQQTLSVITDRSNGGTSLQDGTLEFMLHRRLLVDDHRGVGEPLNELGLDGKGLRIKGLNRLSLGPTKDAGSVRRHLVNDLLFPPLLSYADLQTTPTQWVQSNTAQYSGLKNALPDNVHILTAQSQAKDTLLLRLAHMYEKDEDSVLAQDVSVNIQSLFVGYNVTAVVETTLPGQVPLASQPSYVYNTNDGRSLTLPVVYPAPAGSEFTVTLSPMQIRTFKCSVVALSK